LFSLLFLLTGIFISLHAALTDYTFSSTPGSYQPITGGTEFTILNGTTYADDQKFIDPAILNGGTATTGPGLPIGFNFIFNGSIFDVIGINNNGWISFGQSELGATAVNMATTSANTSLASTSVINPSQLTNRIAALNRDLQAQSSSSLRMQTIGDAPNQICVIQWTNYKRFSTNGAGDSLNFQIRLHQGSNKVEIIYGNCHSGSTVTATYVTYQVGLRGPTTSDFNVRTTTDNWNATTASGVNNATCILNQTVFPASGLTFSWQLSEIITPPNPALIISPADSTLNVHYQPTLNWAPGSGQPTGYFLSVGTDNPPTNVLNHIDLQNINQYIFNSPLAFLTTYYWQVVPYNNFGSATSCPVWSFTTRNNDILSPPTLQDFSETTFPPLDWKRYSGALADTTTLTAVTTGWVRTTNFGNITTGTPNGAGAKMNIYGANRYYWLVSAPVNIPSGVPHQLEFDLALTDYSNSNPIENQNGTDDRFAVVISTDNGMTWSSANILKLWDNDVSTTSLAYDSIATAGQHIIIDLTSYSGICKIAFYGESTTANADNDIHIDNVRVQAVPATAIFEVQPESKVFEMTHINTTSTNQNFYISNIGVGSLGVSAFSIEGANAGDFVLTNTNTLPATIAFGAPIVVSVKFAPVTVGEKTAVLNITDNLGRIIHPVQLLMLQSQVFHIRRILIQ
jgi:hypothetical protein